VSPASSSLESNRTAALIIIGNEVLTGKVEDANSRFLLKQLYELGVQVRRVCVLPDEIDIISAEVREAAQKYDYVFTSGGVGPTHDDVTFRSIAAAFSTELQEHPVLRRLLEERFRGQITEAALRMIRLPVGTELLNANDLLSQVCHIQNVYIFPGVPQMLQAKFSSIRERFRQAPYFLIQIFTQQGESSLAQHLEQTLARHPAVEIGSYPRYDSDEYRVELTLQSKDRVQLAHARDHLLDQLDSSQLVRVVE